MLFWPSDTADPVDTEIAELDDAEFGESMMQVEESSEPVLDVSRASFIDLRRDPMILRLEQGDTEKIKTFQTPQGFNLGRVGAPTSNGLSYLKEPLIIAEKQLITTLPSSRSDFAFFQAERSRGLAELSDPNYTRPQQATETAEAGEVVRVEDDGSWGELISNDDESGNTEDAAVYVETKIKNTTTGVFALRNSQRFALYNDVVVVLQTERSLKEVIQSNGLSEETADQIAQASTRIHGTPEKLDVGSVVALRLKPDFNGVSLMQMSLYGPDGYLSSIAQVGAGRFLASADPWIKQNLLERSGNIRYEALNTQQVRLLDAVYSAGIRNGLPTQLVGEIIVAMSRAYDLDRFAAEGDEIRVLYSTEPGPAGQGLAQALFVGIKGPSGDMKCYITELKSEGGHGCFDFKSGGSAAGGGLSGGLLIPVKGAMTSAFGPRHHPILKQVRNHNGLDWAAPTGTPIIAVAGGKISYAGVAGGYGNVIYINHGNGLETRYAHMSKFGPRSSNGATVEAGEVIGYVGTTGRSTGPHLHFEVRVRGTPMDPMTFAGAPGATTTQASVSDGGTPGSKAVEELVDQIIRVESGGNANAKNPLSTATGLGQFIESTWLRMMRDYRPDLHRSMGRAELLNLRRDPALSREMVRNLARENEAFLRARGHQITSGRLYLSHFLGPAGAHKSLSSAGELTVLQVMGASVVKANPFLRGKSNRDLWAWADRKMGRKGPPLPSTASVRVVVKTIPKEIKDFRDRVDQVLKSL